MVGRQSSYSGRQKKKAEEELSKQIEDAIRHNAKLEIPTPSWWSSESSEGLDETAVGEVIGTILKKRDPEQGRNYLIAAALKGSFDTFDSLLRMIKQHLGQKDLVRQLRDSDDSGSPLLFHAARSEHTESLGRVEQAIRKHIGLGALKDQLQARDLKGRTILFHAVKSGSDAVFDAVVKLKNDNLQTPGRKSWLFEEWELYKTQQENRSPPSATPEMRPCVDTMGMTLLHQACDSGSPALLKKVVKEAKAQSDDFFSKLLSKPDRRGWTAWMHVLRHDCSSENCHIVPTMLGVLSEGLHAEDKIKLFTEPAGEEHHYTTLMHAAHAGPNKLEMARSRILELSKANQGANNGTTGPDEGAQLKLDFALGISESSSAEQPNGQPFIAITRRALLLSEAASGGYISVLEDIVSAIKTGELRQRSDSSKGGEQADDELQQPSCSAQQPSCSTQQPSSSSMDVGQANETPSGPAVDDKQSNEAVGNAIQYLPEDGSETLLTWAISSRKISAVEWVANLITTHVTDKIEAWKLLRGREGGICNLTLAASMPSLPSKKYCAAVMFDTVYGILKKAAEEAYQTQWETYVDRIFVPGARTFDPDVQKVRVERTPLAGSVLSSDKVLFDKVYKTYNEFRGVEQGWTRIQVLLQIPRRSHLGHKDAELYSRVSRRNNVHVSPDMLSTIEKAIREARKAEDGIEQRKEERLTTERLQGLVQGAAELGTFDLFRTGPFDVETIPCLLERIGDYEQNITDAVMLAVESASNPFVTAAVVSKYIQKAESDFPMHRQALRCLLDEIDTLTLKMLDVLPHTVRGIGMEFGTHHPTLLESRKYPEKQNAHSVLGKQLGFLVMQWALEPSTRKSVTRRGGNGEGRDSPPMRTLGYCSMEGPGFIDPLQHALDRGSGDLAFINSPLVLDYMHLKFSESLPSFSSRGCFHYNISETFFTYTPRRHLNGQAEGLENTDYLLRFLQGWEGRSHEVELASCFIYSWPHSTILPGLQFTLAGIVGRPAAFYEVPAVRFAYELLGYIVMLGLYCGCVIISEASRIPINEYIFYIFVLGFLWREILEFRDLLPLHQPSLSDETPSSSTRTSPVRVLAAVKRYLFYDAWNILDTTTIMCVMAAFVFRVIAQRQAGGSPSTTDSEPSALYLAQVFLAASAPLLFARILALSQIDDTLGPMTQIISTMLSHLARFSVFVVIVTASFAVTFFVLVAPCDDDHVLTTAYGTFIDAYLSMFRAMLGDFDFDTLELASNCGLPSLATNALVGLLVLYLVIMSILLLNLLIAILSTVHAEVYENAEHEFHLARARLIQHSWQAVRKGRQPPALNLFMPLAGIVVDLVGAVTQMCRTSSAGNRDDDDKPWSTTDKWDAILTAIHRGLFAITLGSTAVAVLTLLWVVSLPWTAWQLFRLLFPRGDYRQFWSQGYARPSVAFAFSFCGWAVFLVFASLASAVYVVGSIALWLCGFWGIIQCYNTEKTCKPKRRGPHKHDWKDADKIVNRLNGILGDGEGHFRVDLLLHMTTGFDMAGLSSSIKRSEEAERLRARGDSRLREGNVGHPESAKGPKHNATATCPNPIVRNRHGSSPTNHLVLGGRSVSALIAPELTAAGGGSQSAGGVEETKINAPTVSG